MNGQLIFDVHDVVMHLTTENCAIVQVLALIVICPNTLIYTGILKVSHICFALFHKLSISH